MLRVGNHLPSSKGYLAMGKHAVSLEQPHLHFSPETPEAVLPSPLMRRIFRHFSPTPENTTSTIWWRTPPTP